MLLDRHANDCCHRHSCGGTILTGGSGDQSHTYCDRCDWVAYDDDGETEAKRRRIVEFRLTIDLDNVAFESPGELALILRGLAEDVEQYAADDIRDADGVGIYDSNGNRCGRVEIR